MIDQRGNIPILSILIPIIMISLSGLPPPMTYHKIGLMNEVTILKPDLINRLRSMIRLAGSTGSVNLQLMGLGTNNTTTIITIIITIKTKPIAFMSTITITNTNTNTTYRGNSTATNKDEEAKEASIGQQRWYANTSNA